MNRKLFVIVGVILVLALASVVAFAQISVDSAVTSFQIQNTDSADGTVTVTYYNEDGTEDADASQSLSLDEGANINVYQPSVANLDEGFRGNVVLSSDVTIGAIGAQLVTWDNDTQGAANYSGLNQDEVGNTFYLPTILKNFGSGAYSTEIIIQNVGSGSASVTISYYNGSDGSEVSSAEETVTIPENGSVTVAQTDNSNLSDGFLGGAVVDAADDQSIAVIANSYNDQGRLTSYNGFASGSEALFAPTITRAFGGSGFSTSTQIMALEAGDTVVTLNYVDQAGDVSGTHVYTLTQYQSVNTYQGSDDELEDNFIGGATVSANQDVIMVVNSQATGSGLIDTVSYNGIASGGTAFYLPSLSRAFGGGQYTSSFQVFNSDTSGDPAEVSVRFFEGGTEITAAAITLTGSDAIEQHGSASYFLGSLDGLTDGTVYSAIVTSTSGENLVVLGNSKGYGVTGDGSTSYNGLQ